MFAGDNAFPIAASMDNIEVIRPVLLGDIIPPYTDEARDADISGDVTVQCVIRADGTANSCRILKGLGYGLDESTIRAIEKEGRFNPGSIQGVPVDVSISITTTFSMDQ